MILLGKWECPVLKRFYNHLEKYLKPNKVVIIYGARQVGKTTILENFLKKCGLSYRLDSGDNIRIQNLFSSEDFGKIIEYASSYEIIAIDEAQRIPNIGMALKIIVDQVPNIRVIATGSSSFDLAQSIGEPLTGRKKTLTLYPFAQLELIETYPKYELRESLNDFLIFGCYPEVILAEDRKEKIDILKEHVDSYLLKDILTLDKVKNSQTLFNLVKLLAFQVGQLASLNELAVQLHLDVKTVGRYIDLLEKSFIIYKLGGFSRNLRKEITQKSKYYFVDNGIRNAVISQFNPPTLRNDLGALWENFITMERIKKNTYQDFYGNIYFWRTYEGEEIDIIEEQDSQLQGFEIKWSNKKKCKAPKTWVNTYPEAKFNLINSDNYLDYILL